VKTPTYLLAISVLLPVGQSFGIEVGTVLKMFWEWIGSCRVLPPLHGNVVGGRCLISNTTYSILTYRLIGSLSRLIINLTTNTYRQNMVWPV